MIEAFEFGEEQQILVKNTRSFSGFYLRLVY